MAHIDDDFNMGIEEEEDFELPDTEEVPDGSDFDVIPPGQYLVEVEKTEKTKSKKGDKMLKLQLNILEGEFEGRKLFDQIMLTHAESPKAALIGLQRLKMLKVAVGNPTTTVEHDLWMVPIIAKVKIQKDKSGEYGDKNAITAYKPVDPGEAAIADKARQPTQGQQKPATAAAAKPAAAATAKPAAAGNSGKAATPPWSRK